MYYAREEYKERMLIKETDNEWFLQEMEPRKLIDKSKKWIKKIRNAIIFDDKEEYRYLEKYYIYLEKGLREIKNLFYNVFV